MNWLKFILSSLRYYSRQHAGLFLGTALSAAVLVGALLAGDSVSHSLQRFVRLRLGQVEYVLEQNERFFTADLAADLAAALKTSTAPVLKLRGMVIENNSGLRVNNVQVLGVDERFWRMSSQSISLGAIGDNQAFLNMRLARRLNTHTGDRIVLLIEQIDFMPKDTAFSARQNTKSFHLEVQSPVGDDHLGRFSLSSNQVSPLTVFVPLRTLQDKLDLAGKANLILIAERPASVLQLPELRAALKSKITLADMGLSLETQNKQPYFDLISERVFIEPAIEHAVQNLNLPHQPILSYFVNSIDFNKNTTPYSFVSAPGPPLVPDTLNDDEIIILRWLARDLRVHSGDRVELRYFIPAPLNTLEEHSAAFKVQSVIDIKPDDSARSLMPRFSGLSDVENCRDWHPGISIDLSKIRNKDEEYWDLYRGTPKAFITLNAAQKLWQNRFGRVTAIRFLLKDADMASVAKELLNNVSPAALGFLFRPVLVQGLKSSSQAVDFGQLFLGLSFFIIISALLLSALFFVFHRQSRNSETGILKAVGIPPQAIKMAALAEGAGVAFAGTGFGLILGIIYSYLLILGLNTVWQGAVGETSLILFINPYSLLFGFTLAFCAALFFLWRALKSQTKRQISLLQANTLQYNPPLSGGKPAISLFITCVCISCAAVLILFSVYSQELTTPIFFISGTLILCSFIFLLNALFGYVGKSKNKGYPNLFTVGYKNIARRKRRSILTITLLAVGIFCVIAVGVNQQELPATPAEPSSGTGGFIFYAETTLPIIDNLNEQSVKRKLHMEDSSLAGASYVQLRVRPGDDASCLNLNRTANPRLLGVDPLKFAQRNSFSFETAIPEIKGENPWLALHNDLGENVIPAVADQTVITWGLGMNIGDELSYIDEKGREIKLKLIAGLNSSIFQGSILISEKQFITHFPSISGYRIVLADGITPGAEQPGKIISAALTSFGIDLETAAGRLARFHVVENTYLLMFLMLGGLGLLIGSIGFGVIILRNVAESRNEYAILQAVGFNKKSIALLILYEHLTLLILGMACGTLAALTALIPHFTKALPNVPLYLTAFILFTLLASGIFWSYLGTKTALKGSLISVLREE
ncbi:MAG: ABC transporter permease [Spirochaetales bacterium]|nr:ABC transporter permease [Spirochaetales bacterium]